MPQYRFRILNVFAETPLGGNPLAVFENAAGLDAATMRTGGRVIEIGSGEIHLR